MCFPHWSQSANFTMSMKLFHGIPCVAANACSLPAATCCFVGRSPLPCLNQHLFCILCPILFNIYVAPLTTIVRNHGLNIVPYGDDTQLILFSPRTQHHQTQFPRRDESCHHLDEEELPETQLRENRSPHPWLHPFHMGRYLVAPCHLKP